MTGFFYYRAKKSLPWLCYQPNKYLILQRIFQTRLQNLIANPASNANWECNQIFLVIQQSDDLHVYMVEKI